MHTLVGAGSVSRGNGGGLDISNLLKPALARGELQCIGATTLGALLLPLADMFHTGLTWTRHDGTCVQQNRGRPRTLVVLVLLVC